MSARERLANYGPGALSNAELLAIILRIGSRDENVIRMAQRVLSHFDGLPGLAQAPMEDLIEQKGIGPAKAVELKAAFELGRRWQSPRRRATAGEVAAGRGEPADAGDGHPGAGAPEDDHA